MRNELLGKCMYESREKNKLTEINKNKQNSEFRCDAM